MIKTLAKSIREYKTKSILTPITMIGEAAMEILIPFVMSLLIKVIEEKDVATQLTSGDVGKVVLYGALMFVMALFSLFCGAVCGKIAAEASAGFAANLRKDMYENIQKFAFSNIDKYSTASLITRLTTDVTNVQQCYQMIIRGMVRSPILFIFATVMSFAVAPNIAWIFVVSALVLALVIVFIITKVQKNFKLMFEKYDDLNSVTQENLTAIRVVKSYVREDYETKKFKDATEQVYNYSIKAEKLLTVMMPIVQIVMYATMLVLLAVGGTEIISAKGIAISDLTALLNYATQILMGVIMMSMLLNFIAMSKNSAVRIAEILEERTDIVNNEETVKEVKDGSIDFENVTFAYKDGGANILENLSIHIPSGSTVGIIGGTGSAKSTFVQLIPRLYDIQQGSIKVGGVDVKDYDMEVLRDNVAMVLQKNVLFSGSVTENLKWGDENATREEIEKAAELAQAADFISRLPHEYDYDLGQGGVNVSGGQKQRLCIARALLKKPKILIFDDSTSAVDTKTDALIRAGLKKYAPDVTKLIIAQRIASVQEADKIIVMDQGKIVAYDTHENLLKNNSIYQEVYYSQVKGGEEK